MSHSEAERQQALAVVDLFRDKGTRDELGIGRIRDALSERLFPGTSTIQTRAGYFLFVPWLYLDLERRRVQSADIERKARGAEVKLIEALAASDDPAGTIGIRARGSLERFPSQIYWGGLGTWGIRLFPGHRGHYHQSLDGFYCRLDGFATTEIEDTERRPPRNWHAGLPEPPEDFPERASFQLRSRDAEYLRERIYFADRSSLLAYLVEDGDPETKTGLPWQHPVMGRLPEEVRTVVDHARNFSEALHGAALLYNLMMSERSRDEGLKDAELAEDYQADLNQWAAKITARSAALRSWNRQGFWALLEEISDGIGPRTYSFVNAWFDLLLRASDPRQLQESQSARNLIYERERILKGDQARLDLEHRRPLELWGGDSGSDQLDYRWKASVQRIVRDILDGLARGDERAVAG